MNEIDVSGLLAQMRAMAAQTQSLDGPSAQVANTGSFAELLGDSIDAVSQTQQRAADLAREFELDAANVELADVMISLQKADISFKAMTEVRNQLVSAYQEIMNMPV